MWSVIVVLKILCVLTLCQTVMSEQLTTATTDQIITSTEPPDISETTYQTTASEDDPPDASSESTTPFPTTASDSDAAVMAPTEEDDDAVSNTESPDAYSTIFLMPSNRENELDAQESKIVREMFIEFEPKKFPKEERNDSVPSASGGSGVQFTSYLADSETAVPMSKGEMELNKSRGADMISAFLIAPDDEVNEIDKTKYSGRPIVVSNLNEELVRTERYTGQEETKTLSNILAPIRAGVSLSHEKEEPMIEKQELKEQPVYKTIIEIQKSIPYEIKDIEQPTEIERPISNDLAPQLPVIPNRPPVRAPLYYRYPMYYLPQSYIGHYIMRHSHENANYRPPPVAQTQATTILPIQYYFRYQPLIVAHPYFLADPSSLNDYNSGVDQNTLHSEPKTAYQNVNHHHGGPPFRPSHPVFTSQYPPYTYRVLSTMRARGARSAKSKQFWVEYGGFKPPMVPSVQLDDKNEQPQDVKSVSDEKTES